MVLSHKSDLHRGGGHFLEGGTLGPVRSDQVKHFSEQNDSNVKSVSFLVP